MALQAIALREYDEALARAGDLRGALELFHRERALNAQVMQSNREAALKQLQQRNDRERKQRDIELLAATTVEEHGALNRELMLRVWTVAAVVLGLLAAVVALLTGASARPTASSSRARPSCACRASATR